MGEVGKKRARVISRVAETVRTLVPEPRRSPSDRQQGERLHHLFIFLPPNPAVRDSTPSSSSPPMPLSGTGPKMPSRCDQTTCGGKERSTRLNQRYSHIPTDRYSLLVRASPVLAWFLTLPSSGLLQGIQPSTLVLPPLDGLLRSCSKGGGPNDQGYAGFCCCMQAEQKKRQGHGWAV